MIKNKFETSTLSQELFPVSGKQAELSFSGDQIYCDGGLLLLREVKNQISNIDNLSQYYTDNRDQHYIDYTVKEVLTQRIMQIASRLR